MHMPQDAPKTQDADQIASKKTERREIPGGVPYSTSPGVFKTALERIVAAERPDKFSGDFMATVLKISGGSSRPVPPLFKKMGFITSDGSPTDLYSKFKTDGGRSQAAYEGLRAAFAEVFRRNEYAHKLDEAGVVDLLVEITGLKRNDQVLRYMAQTFEAIRSFIRKGAQVTETEADTGPSPSPSQEPVRSEHAALGSRSLGLAYNINIVLPETENIAVFNAIFRSLRENLLS
jgi:hypothetical protein